MLYYASFGRHIIRYPHFHCDVDVVNEEKPLTKDRLLEGAEHWSNKIEQAQLRNSGLVQAKFLVGEHIDFCD